MSPALVIHTLICLRLLVCLKEFCSSINSYTTSHTQRYILQLILCFGHFCLDNALSFISKVIIFVSFAYILYLFLFVFIPANCASFFVCLYGFSLKF